MAILLFLVAMLVGLVWAGTVGLLVVFAFGVLIAGVYLAAQSSAGTQVISTRDTYRLPPQPVTETRTVLERGYADGSYERATFERRAWGQLPASTEDEMPAIVAQHFAKRRQLPRGP